MKKITPAILLMFILSACSGWNPRPLPYNPPTIAPSATPLIYSPTPVIIAMTPVTVTAITPTSTPAFTVTPPSPLPTLTFAPTTTSFATLTATITNTPTATHTPTSTTVGVPSIQVDVLGCNTGIDVSHGMGEVTNAFITLRNTGMVNATNLSATLIALDEGRVHPDKTVVVASLPAGYKVTLKLTVDSTYKQETPIQIEISGDGGIFQRVGQPSCRDIGVLTPDPASLRTPVPSS